MSYTALYRKFRPKSFDEIIGQEHIVKILSNQLKTNRVSHAYLLCGTRGTGKTSTAKVFAKSLNCTAPNGANPCGVCEACKSIEEGSNLNITEIDAASNNGVDNIREIREEVKYPPSMGKYKVYIIDEVHMLSAGAFNALLKTLEEPPAHVVFILATTDPQKIPATIHSRCQRLDFRRIKPDDMIKALKGYMEEENIAVDEKALRYIASVTDGAMRDALSLLDQCSAFYYGEALDIDKVLKITGSADNSVFYGLALALSNFNSQKIIEIIAEAADSGKDMSQLLSDFIGYLRNMLISVSVGANILDMSDGAFAELKEQGEQIGSKGLINYITSFSALQSQLRYSQNPRILLETACIKLANPQAAGPEANPALLERLQRVEKLLERGAVTFASPAKGESPEKPPEPMGIIPKAVPEDIQKVISTWKSFLGGLDVVLNSFMAKSVAGYTGDGALNIVTQKGKDDHLKMRKKEISAALTEKYGKEFNIVITDSESYDSRHRDKYGCADEAAAQLNKKEIDEKLNGFATYEE